MADRLVPCWTLVHNQQTVSCNEQYGLCVCVCECLLVQPVESLCGWACWPCPYTIHTCLLRSGGFSTTSMHVCVYVCVFVSVGTTFEPLGGRGH